MILRVMFVRKKDLFEQNAALFNRLQSVSAELEKYKTLYSENITEINSLRRRLADIELEAERKAAEEQEKEPEPPTQADEVQSPTEEMPLNPLSDVVLENNAMQKGAEVIGRIVFDAAKICNEFADKQTEYSKDLINLVLGKTEVAKSEIYEICRTEQPDERKLISIDAVYDDTADYFSNLRKQI